MKSRFFHKNKDLFFLLIFTVLAYWPVSFMMLSLKNDAINYFLAVRYNSSEALQHGFFPYWTSYINLGYPLHGDIQSGVWNPVVFLMSLIRQFDLYWLHTEIILINFIAGIGMYRLLSYFRLERKVVLLVACAYVLNGFITDSGQFQNWLYAAAILPWVFLYLIKTFTSFSIKDAFGLGVAHSMMFLCAYPADTILLSYTIVAYAIASLIAKSKQTSWAQVLKKHAYVSFIALLTLVIICLPAILSFIEFIPLIKRGEGLPIADAMANSMAPANLISLVTPWPTMRGNAFAETDPLIRNSYMGLVCLVFLLWYFFTKQKKNFNQRFLIGMMIFFLLFSFGMLGGIRLLSYHLLPLMNSFRHPANAKLFFIFSGQLMAAFAIQQWLGDEERKKNTLRKISIFIISLCSLAFIISLFKSSAFSIVAGAIRQGNPSVNLILKDIRDQFSFYDLLMLNSFFALLIMITFLLLLNKGRLKKWLVPLALFDLFIIAQFMLPLTYVKKASVASVQSLLDPLPKGYPIPDINISLAEFSRDGELYFERIGCLNPYNKKPGRTDYSITPSNLLTQENFWDYTKFRQLIMKNPIAYFADTVFATTDSIAMINYDSSVKSALADNIVLNTSTGIKNEIRIIRFDPGHYLFQTKTTDSSFFVVLQNNFPRWRATINDQPVAITTTNITFMGVKVPPGSNTIVFTYKADHLGWLGLFSIIFIITGCCYFALNKKYKSQPG